jgi:hypothetical protein
MELVYIHGNFILLLNVFSFQRMEVCCLLLLSNEWDMLEALLYTRLILRQISVRAFFLRLMVESNEPIATIPTQESKATVAGWSFLDRYIIMGHENGMVSQWDWKVCLLMGS